MSTVIKGPQELEKEVIKADLCTLCGACVGLCPYLRAHKGKVVVMDNCNLSQGRCYSFCPRTPANLEALNQFIFGTPYPGDSLGTFQKVVMAKSLDKEILSKGQYGGITSTLVAWAMKKRMIDAAILTKREKELLSSGKLAKDKKQVLACAGSNYIASPTLEAFNKSAGGSYKRIAAVGIPCQVLALGKMRLNPLENKNNIEKLSLVIGLFCTWALSYREFFQFLQQEVPIKKIAKMDIPPPPANVFQVQLPGGVKSISLDHVRNFIRPTCTVCLDMTAEFSDLSVGAVEGISGWNTVIVRTAKGQELLEDARRARAIEVAEIPKANLNHLKEAALLKKKRALENIVKRTGSKENLLYLQGADSLRSLLPS
ncbi:MAG: Coenzyme F420 hydrogenase/dehydrogenase, beta subunit C-terminal domain [Deltaproteobacteria bacterium]|nr:Coenzyme F420 hydrogenase/dehydrogenase, beta subunit C-terminal domain [Deltaproteobacteria bacterium]